MAFFHAETAAHVRAPKNANNLLRYRLAGQDMCIAILGTDVTAHMAIRIARATGAEISVLTPHISRLDHLWLGADHYFPADDPATYRALEGAFDLIVCLAPDTDVKPYLALLKWNGAVLIMNGDTDVTVIEALAFCGLNLQPHQEVIA